MGFTVIIPARLQSTRLPGKVLLPINGKPMLQHVYERAQASEAERIVICSADDEILSLAQQLGAIACETHDAHPTGTDRIVEAVTQLDLAADDIIVGLQGDEPMLPSELINQVAVAVEKQTAPVATLRMPIDQQDELLAPDIVKVVTDCNGHALYFSRASIPYPRAVPDETTDLWHRHVGMYAYRRRFLADYATWQPAAIEELEQLEQLRILWQGESIYVETAAVHPGHGVDTQADLDLVASLLS